MANDAGGNVVLEKSYGFALGVIRLSSFLQREEREFVLSRQLVRSGTSIGANIEEAQAAQTRKDFHSMMCRAEKEARESHYWLRLIRDSFPAAPEESISLLEAASELKRILSAITKTTKE
jgi:four helix bundle protein